MSTKVNNDTNSSIRESNEYKGTIIDSQKSPIASPMSGATIWTKKSNIGLSTGNSSKETQMRFASINSTLPQDDETEVDMLNVTPTMASESQESLQ